MPTLNGGQVIARILKSYGVPYVAGIPGHGIWGLMDAFNEDESKIPFIQTYHEQSAVHLADGYYRVSGKPMAAVTSIGAGASNTVLGLATAYSDSTSVLVITGGPPRHMRGRGVLQELERQKDNGFPQIAEAVSKRSWVANSIEDLPFIMHRAFSAMLTGRGTCTPRLPRSTFTTSTAACRSACSTRTPRPSSGRSHCWPPRSAQ